MPDLSTVNLRAPLLPRSQPVSGTEVFQSQERHPEKPQTAIIEEATSDTGIVPTGGRSPGVSLSGCKSYHKPQKLTVNTSKSINGGGIYYIWLRAPQQWSP